MFDPRAAHHYLQVFQADASPALASFLLRYGKYFQCFHFTKKLWYNYK